MHGNWARLTLDHLALSRKINKLFAPHLQGGIHRRHLQNITDKGFGYSFYLVFGRNTVRARQHFTRYVLGIGGDAERQPCHVSLAVRNDEIGRFAYNIDIHSPTNDKAGYENFMKEHMTFCYKDGESYGIPYRSLAVKGITNLLTAGRCIGSDRYMQSSIRVMPGCYITGQAAGIAAAVVCDAHADNVHEVDVREVQKRLIAIGGYLPNYRD